MVVGHQHLPAARLGRSDASVTGDAVVDGDQQVGLQRSEFIDQRRRQTVAVDHAVGHRVRHPARAQHAQPAYAHRTGGGAIAIEIADHHDVAIGGDRCRQQCRRGIQSQQGIRRQQVRQSRHGLFDRQRTPRAVDPLQQWWNVSGPRHRGHGVAAAQCCRGRGHAESVAGTASTNDCSGRRQNRQRWPEPRRKRRPSPNSNVAAPSFPVCMSASSGASQS